jgi:hypothetical protein
MGHMDYGVSTGEACADGLCAGSPRIVTYTATGSEGVDFMVPIGTTLATDEYEVGLFGIAGAANYPILDFPNTLAGDRTDSEFRVLSAAVLTLGDILKFQVVEV